MQEAEVFLIGIDDTDNKETRGTGFRSRQLAALLEDKSLGQVMSVSRHQLYVHEEIPYTSQNSSACLVFYTNQLNETIHLCIDFVKETSAPGSDVGLCIAKESDVNTDIIDWGMRAKKEVLQMDRAYELAKSAGIFLKGYTGTKCGVIGALAAVGLRKWGNDGRNIWLAGSDLRQIEGVYTKKQLLDLINVQEVIDIDEEEIQTNDRIFVSNWLRPIIRESKNIIIVEKDKNNTGYEWKIVSKDLIKKLSN